MRIPLFSKASRNSAVWSGLKQTLVSSEFSLFPLFSALLRGFCRHCWLFFGYGAYYGIRKKEFIVAMLPYALPAFILLLVLIVIEQWFPGEFLYRLQHVVAIVFGMSFTTIMVRAGTWYVQDMSLSNASFFVYAFLFF